MAESPWDAGQVLRRLPSSGSNVFVPVLLGAGVILSAIAFVVERFAGVVARATIDRRAARRLVDLEPPDHGLLGAPGRPRQRAAGPGGRRVGAASRAVVLTMLAVLVVAGVDVLGDATQSRPAPLSEGTTVVALNVAQRRVARRVDDAAEALVVACRGTLPAGVAVLSVAPVDADTVEVEVAARLPEPRRRRFFGCLEDATLVPG